MRSKNLIVWLGLLALAVLATLAAHFFPRFPWDVAVARGVQAAVPQDLGWALGVSRAVDFPWILLILALILALSWILAGWRAALLASFSLAGMLFLGLWLCPVIARPRPAPELVRVFRSFSGYSFPSFSVLCSAATFGYLAVLAAVKASGWRRAGCLLGCGAVLILAGAARIALGAHWLSDVIISYYLGLLWAAILIEFFLPGSTPKRQASRQDEQSAEMQAGETPAPPTFS